jgi:hypothetical protein
VLIIKFGAEAVGAGAASLYGIGSVKMMRLLSAPALQHWYYCMLQRPGSMKLYTVYMQDKTRKDAVFLLTQCILEVYSEALLGSAV